MSTKRTKFRVGHTEQDLQRAKSFVIGAGGVEICLCPDENCRPRFESELAAEFSRIRSEARAGMREACAKAMDDELAKLSKEEDGKDEMHPLIAGEVYGWTAAKAKCLSLPDTAADEAIERIKREVRLEEAKHWQEKVRSLPRSASFEEQTKMQMIRVCALKVRKP